MKKKLGSRRRRSSIGKQWSVDVPSLVQIFTWPVESDLLRVAFGKWSL